MGAEKFYGLGFDPAQGHQFAEGFGNFADQRTPGHRYDYVVRQAPAELLGDFETVRLGAFGVVRAQVDVDQAPLEAVGDLGAEAVDLVVVAIDADDAGAVDGGIQNFCGLEIGWDEDAGVKALLGRLGGYGIGEIAGRGAAYGLEAEAASGNEGGGYDAVFEGKRREADCVVLKIKIFHAPVLGQFSCSDQRSSAGGVGGGELFGKREEFRVTPHIERAGG